MSDDTNLQQSQDDSDFAFEEALSSRTVLDLFFEESLDLFCVADRTGFFRKVNPRFEEVLGYSPEELTSRPYLDFVHPEDREITKQTLQKLEDDQAVIGFRNRYISRDDNVVWLEWHARPVDDLVYATARNITDLKRAEAERAKLKAQFQEAQKLESVAVLAGGIAHDFNNLLTTIIGNAGLIPLMTSEDNPAADRADAILEAAQAAADLCEQLLAYAGKGQFNVEYRDLTSIVDETDHLLEAAVDRSVDLNFDLDDHLPAAELDDTQIRQILMNVVKNASEAIEEAPGEIRVATGLQRCSREFLADCFLDDDLEPGQYVYLEIEDTGCGMTRAEIKRIFDPFFTTKSEGRGLGLAASLGILRAHNGALKIDSELGEGTTFRFLFPALETNTPFTPQNPLPAARPVKDESVLVVDEEREIREFVCRSLEQKGVNALGVADARETLTAFHDGSEDYSTVVLDTTLPDIEPRRLYDKLLDLDASLDVILTGGQGRHEALEPFPEDADIEFLRKPYGPQELLRALAKTIA